MAVGKVSYLTLSKFELGSIDATFGLFYIFGHVIKY